MKISDIEQAIKYLYQDFGSKAGDMTVYLDATFDNELIVELSEEMLTTLVVIPNQQGEDVE